MRVLISWILRASICSVRCLVGYCGALRGSGGWRVTIHEFCVRIVTQFSEIPRKFRMKQANLSFEHYLNHLSYSGNLSPKFCRNNVKTQSFTVVPKLPSQPRNAPQCFAPQSTRASGDNVQRTFSETSNNKRPYYAQPTHSSSGKPCTLEA